MRKFLAVFLAGILLWNSVPQTAYAAERFGHVETETAELPARQVSSGNMFRLEREGTGSEVTRLEWLKALTAAFSMRVEEDNYPDNYYTDIDASSPDYYDVMLATEFGLVDVEAGDPLCPDDAATREFAAHTLNLCLGYQPEEDSAYTFNEADTVTYPEDIQIAVARGWFTLSEGNFLPQQAVTEEEKEELIAMAKEVYNGTKLDPEHENFYQLQEGVIQIPVGTQVLLTDDDELTFYDYDGTLAPGDIFVMDCQGLPVARRVLQVQTQNHTMVVKVEGVETEEAFSALDVQGSIEADLSQAQAIGEDVTLTYIVGGTEEEEYEDGVTCYSLREVADRKVNAVIATKTFYPSAPEQDGAGTPYYTPNPETEGFKISCKISDVKPEYKFKSTTPYIKVSAKLSLAFSTDWEGIEIPNFENPFEKIPIGTLGYLKPVVEGRISGSASVCLKGKITAGAEYNHGPRLIHEFQKEAFTLDLNGNIKIGAKASAGIDASVVKGELYAEAGAIGSAKTSIDQEGKRPERCTHVSAYLYVNVGGKITFNVVGIKTEVKNEKQIYGEDNSPVKIVLHYEDGQKVPECTRKSSSGGSSGGSSGTGGSGGANPYKYYTPFNSQYAYNGANKGTGTNGKEYTIFEYKLNGNKQAIITKYNGNVSALNIPEELDGYTVVGIDNSVFSKNTKIHMVNIPDTVKTIGCYAFSNCSNLASVRLSKSLVRMGRDAFYNCDSLTSIEIPKSLRTLYYGRFDGEYIDEDEDYVNDYEEYGEYGDYDDDDYSGAFENCDNLKNITFENGTTTIIDYLFHNCSGLEEIVIPYTVTRIGFSTFKNCRNLKKVELSKALVRIGEYAFKDCDSLTSIEIPKSLARVEYMIWDDDEEGGAFEGCDNLRNVTFEEGTISIMTDLLYNCVGLEEIVIPDTVTVIGDRAFKYCKNLKKIKLPLFMTSIGDSLFESCGALTEIEIPDTVKSIGCNAFANCRNLKDVRLSKSLVRIGAYAFKNCGSLASIEIPKSLAEIDDDDEEKVIFKNCDNLKNATFEEGTTRVIADLFYNCKGLEEIVIPDTVTVIEDRAFKDCNNLKKIKLSSSVTSIGDSVFYNCGALTEIELPDKVTSIGDSVFRNCGALREIEIPDTVTSMGTYIFAGCTSLASVKLPNKRVNITEGTFKNCTSLKNITLPETVEVIREYAFENSGLTELILPDNVEIIEYRAFGNNSFLARVVCGEKLKTIGNYAFYDCDALAEITLSDNLKTIGNYAFYDCDALTAITIPDSVTSIGTNCFEKCDLLEEVTLGAGLTNIPSYAFNACPSIKKIVLPYRMETVQSNAFTNCTGLTELVIPRATTSIKSNAFSYPKKMKVYGVSGTYAQEWADSVGAAFVPQDIPATEVSLSQNSITLAKGAKATLVLTVMPTDFTDEVTWKSSDSSIVTVDDKGVITAKGIGEATIRVTVGNASASCKVTVAQPVTSISLNKTVLSLYAPETCQLTASVAPDNANNKQIAWSSSDETVATVDKNGLVTAVSKGTAVITAQAQDGSGVKRTCNVTVMGVIYTVSSVSGLESAHDYANNSTDTWIYTLSGKKNLQVTFDERTELEENFDYLYLYDGKDHLIGKYTGTELAGKTITVSGDTVKIKLESDKAGTAWGFKVTSVKEWDDTETPDIPDTPSDPEDIPATAVALDQKSITLAQGGKATLIPTITPADSTDKMTWKSSDSSVVTVDEKGVLTAKGIGEATVQVTAGSVSASCKVTVVQPVTAISLNKTSLSLTASETCQLTASVAPDNANNKQITWLSSDETVATVDETGLVTAVSKGTAVITAKAKDGSGVQAVCDVTVTEASHIVTSVDELESKHNYSNNCEDFWVYTLSGKKSLQVTFDERTEMEEDFDYLYLYDGQDNLVGKYTGTELAGKTITVSGDTVKIKLESDKAGTAWGFKVTSVTGLDDTETPDIPDKPSDPEDIPATAVALDKNSITLAVGGEATLIPTITPADSTDEVTWKSSNLSVVTVDGKGVLAAKGVGEATVRITVGSVSASCKVTVVQPVTAISLNQTALSLLVPETYQLTASVAPESAGGALIAWSSSDETVAVVDETGLVTAVSKGKAVITAKAKDGSGVQAACDVTVTGTIYTVSAVDELESEHNYSNYCMDSWVYTLSGKKSLQVTFDERTEVEEDFDYLYLYDGQDNLVGKYTGTELAGKTITVSGDTVKIKLEADKAGTAWGFKVTSVTGADTLAVALTGLKIQGATRLALQEKTSLSVSKLPENTTDTRSPVFASSAPSVAKVDAKGNVTAVAVGTAVITASIGDIKTTHKIEVYDPTPISLKLKKTSATIQVGKTVTIQVDSKYPANDTVTFKSSNTKVASVNGSGKVTGKATGTAKITVKTKSGATAFFTVKVVNIKLKKTSATIQAGKTVTIQVSSKYPANDTVTFKSSNPKVAAVNGSGKVTGKAAGTAKITVKTKSGATAVFTVKVVDIKLKKTSATIKVGKSTTIQISSLYPKKDKVTYKSSNTKIATVTAKGKVTGKKAGTAKISVTTKSGAKAVFTVKVKK